MPLRSCTLIDGHDRLMASSSGRSSAVASVAWAIHRSRTSEFFFGRISIYADTRRLSKIANLAAQFGLVWNP
jgi:hypothetical protein